MIDALYISDASHSLVYEYSSKLLVPSFKSLLHKIYDLDATSTGFDSTTTSATNKNLPSTIALNVKYDLIIHRQNSLSFVLLCSKEDVGVKITSSSANPLLPHTFIERLIETLEEFFGELSSSKISNHNDVVTLILYQMLDDGSPNITDFNKLRDLVKHNSLLTKILNEAQRTTGYNQSNTGQAFSNDIPWRRADVRHTSNEMYVDVIETVSLLIKPIVKRNKVEHFDSAFYSSKNDSLVDNYILNGHIDGRIDFLCHLTGVPTLELILNKVGAHLELPSLHRCVNYDLFRERRGVLSFIPPDGKTTLMKYDVDLNQMLSYKEKMNLIKLGTIDVQFLTNESSSDFEIKIFPAQMINKVEFVKIKIVCADSNDQVKVNRITHGDFQNKINRKHEWSIRDIKKNVVPTLSGSIVTDADNDDEQEKGKEEQGKEIGGGREGEREREREKQNHKNENEAILTSRHKAPLYLEVEYCHKGSVPSGLKVESLKIKSARGLGENVKPFKGVKYITNSGHYIVRS